ncbi:MAG: hypothetical protein ACRDQB_15600, partial [Thermocrispum sp.]
SVRVVIPADVAREFRGVLARFIETLTQGLAGKGRFAWVRGLDPLVPPVHGSRARSREFRREHAVPLRHRLVDAAHRVDRQLATGPEFTLSPDDVADWVAVCGHAQSLYVTERWGRKPLKRAYHRDVVRWLIAVQDAVADAALDHFVTRVIAGTA